MSAINVLREPHKIYMFTDGVHYLQGGVLMAVGPKVMALPHLQAAIAARAPSLFLPVIGQELACRCESFDDLIENGVDIVRDQAELFAPLFSRCNIGSSFDLVIAGFSKIRNRGETYSLTDIKRRGSVPWVLESCGPEVISPGDDSFRERMQTLQQSPLNPGPDYIAAGLALMEEQRGVLGGVIGRQQEIGAGVGGFCQLTTITREAIETRILRRWNDRIGEPLGQELTPVQRLKLGVQAAPASQHMSRQERRRAERTAGRR